MIVAMVVIIPAIRSHSSFTNSGEPVATQFGSKLGPANAVAVIRTQINAPGIVEDGEKLDDLDFAVLPWAKRVTI
jgi:hypothetical protein